MPEPYVSIPETITVHLGAPSENAQNITVPFADYIKNVASSEIYPTWPEAAIRANIYAQIIDDVNGVTLVSANTLEKEFEGATGNCEAAKKVGAVLAERAKEKGIEEVVFDRGGYVYHGRIAALADGAREAGLKF